MVLGMEFFPGFMSGFGGVDSSSVCMGGELASSHYFSWRCMGLAPVVATAFSTYKSPKFYLSFTILVSFILVRYPDRIDLRYRRYYKLVSYAAPCDARPRAAELRRPDDQERCAMV